MILARRIDGFVELGRKLTVLSAASKGSDTNIDEELLALTVAVQNGNAWFTPASVISAIEGISSMLFEKLLVEWTARYSFPDYEPLKNVGVIMAGNIPAVGFHDAMCILLSGNRLKAKVSSLDLVLITYILDQLAVAEPGFKDRIEITTGQLKDIDAIIATGSNNSSRYFEYYFGKYPHIIRGNRNSSAVLTGAETKEELEELNKDIFTYFGLGCRNVSKLFVPQDYNFDSFFEAAEKWSWLKNHNKYFNNYEYSKAVFLVNSIKHFDNGFLLVKEDLSLHSPVAVLHYETYENIDAVKLQLLEQADQLQCVVSSPLTGISGIAFGETQLPGPSEYADRLDTMEFLIGI